MTFESGNTEFSTDIFNSFVYMHGYIHLLYILLELMQSLTCFIISCADILKTLVAVSGGGWHSYRRTCFKVLSSMSEDDSFTMCTIKHLTAVNRHRLLLSF